jgi:hypothetical protein
MVDPPRLHQLSFRSSSPSLSFHLTDQEQSVPGMRRRHFLSAPTQAQVLQFSSSTINSLAQCALPSNPNPTLSDSFLSPVSSASAAGADAEAVDYTKIPKLLDSKFEAMDKEGAVRPTIINVGKRWTKTSKQSLLASPVTSTLGADEQKKERSAAFDLLDALTKSGGFEVHDASLHVVIAATHCFDRSLVDTVVQRNVNPIEKVEFSSLIMASTIHNERVENLVSRDQVARLLEHSPSLAIE